MEERKDLSPDDVEDTIELIKELIDKYNEALTRVGLLYHDKGRLVYFCMVISVYFKSIAMFGGKEKGEEMFNLGLEMGKDLLNAFERSDGEE